MISNPIGLPRGRCPILWCIVAHALNGDQRTHLSAAVSFHNVAITLAQAETAGHLDEPIVRLSWLTADGRHSMGDLPPSLAADLGELLTCIRLQELGDVGSAMHRAGVTLGAHA
ncbi:hypothetical protein IMZ11_25565 [Microtetraspora sp. AC03309]|uniref:hypothetical protein n=1 Tax=Microtetraspora sp. AC03309 TaxID=2779376 RepID=UPI001E577721|nr:hypothetical protein [Microtetraspora sp. AC03309]MCC5578999.1 hypothetical protein [Microtetraspora sp. AC03309]